MNLSSDHQTAAWYAEYESGLTCYDLARKYHYAPQTIWYRFKSRGLKVRTKAEANRLRRVAK